MRDFWDDHSAMRPGTPGGDAARQSFANSIRVDPLPLSPPEFPKALKPSNPPKAAIPPKPLTRVDLAVAAAVWLVVWLILWRSAEMGGLAAFFAAIIPSAMAARWWRTLLLVGFVGIVLWFFLRHAK